MNRTRIRGIFENLLLEMQEAKLIDYKGVMDIGDEISKAMIRGVRKR
jgi:hypothetical protein